MNRYRAYMDRIHAPSGLRYRVLEAAERGLFHCQMRFEDDVPKDPVNQQRMRKILAKQGIACSFTCAEFDVQRVMPGNVTMKLHWGPQVEAQIAEMAQNADPDDAQQSRTPGAPLLVDAPSSSAVC